MDIKFNFGNEEISKNVIKFLVKNLRNEEDKNCLKRIDKGNKLNYMDANSLIQAMLKAIVIENEDNVSDEVLA